jgi:predicted nucleic acid-binding protein
MTERSFIDTNVWVCRVDRAEPIKREAAASAVD